MARKLTNCAKIPDTEAGQILTPLQLYNWASSNVTGIIFLFVSRHEVHRITASAVTQRIPASNPLQQRKDVVLLMPPLLLLLLQTTMKVNNPTFSSSAHDFLQINSSALLMRGIVSQNRGP